MCQNIYCKTFFFACIYFPRFSRFELHSRTIQDSENFNVDYFYSFRPFFMYFGCFSGICRLLLSLLFVHSREIDALEIYPFYSTPEYPCMYAKKPTFFHGSCNLKKLENQPREKMPNSKVRRNRRQYTVQFIQQIH